ncbi:MAG: HD-GYP domain-containing protein [Bacteriovoracaceae bacterium]
MSKKKDNVISLPNLVGSVVLNNMAGEIDQLKKDKKVICEQAARTILYALGCKDDYTYGHSMRVAHYSLCVGKEMGLNEEELYDLELSALFHDIGKIGTPDKVLLKPSRLDELEFAEMKKHPVISGEILSQFDGFKNIAKYARHHHERYDGRGYPDGLKGEEIPLFSRIILIADTFDAMTSSRPYREGLTYNIAFEELEEFAGSQFDPNVVNLFIEAMKKEEAQKEDEFYISIMQQKFKKAA